MTEGTKTGTMAIIAGVIALLAWTTSSRTYTVPDAKSAKGKILFEKFSDPVTAASLKILRYDSSVEDYVEFEVAQDRKSGIWTLPSHESYPADATKQMSDAANLFVGMKTIDVASEKREDQELFGVIEPDKKNAEKGGKGVGMLVQMRDSKGDMLADLIIGKETDNKQRFVRVPSEDVIYVAEIDTVPLSTEFKQWIEADLLKLSSNDVETIGIRDYQLIQVNQGLALNKEYDADLTFSTSNGQWLATKITNYALDPPADRQVGPDEQLNTTKLNEMKSALDNLRIADVAKKPAGLAGDLKGDKSLLANQESLASLNRRGFFPNPNQQGGETVDFYSKSGELVVTLKDGVQYVLRFGNGTAEIGASESKDSDPALKSDESVSFNRYLLVTTRVDESKFPAPDLEKVPESIEELKAIEELKKPPKIDPVPVAPESTEPETVPVDPSVPTTEPATNETPVIEPAAATDTPAASPESPSATEPKPTEPGVPEGDKPSSPVSVNSTSQIGKFVSFQEPQESQLPEAVPVAALPAAQTPEVEAEPTEEEWKERLEAAKEKITKENQRKIDQRNEKLQLAKKKVAELNGRFADWYYIVSEEDFKKMKISLSDLLQPKTSSSGSGGPGGAGFPGGAGGFPGGFPGGQ